MASFPIPAIRKRGPILNGLTALPASVKMMTVDDAGNMGTQDIPVAPVLSWGNITGTLSTQTDLQTALNAKSSVGHVHAISDVTGLSDVLIALDAAKLNTTSFNFASIGGNAGDNTSLAAALAGKANTSHTHAISDVTNLQSSLDGKAAFVHTHSISDVTALQTALDAKANSSALASYLPLAGGTVSGQILFSGTGAGLGMAQLQSASSNWFIYSGGTFQSPLFNCNGWYGMVDGANGGMQFFSGHGIVWSGSGTSGTLTRNSLAGDIGLYRDSAGALGQRFGTTAQRLNLYGTYTDASNYRRLYLSSTTAGAFTLGVEGLGTGASGNTLTIANALGVSGSVSATTGAFSGALSVGGNITPSSGSAGSGRLEMVNQQYTPSNLAINMPWGTGTQQGIYGSNGLVGFASSGTSYFEVNTSGLRVAGTRSIGLGGTIASPEVTLFSGSNVLEQRNGTNSQTFRIYNAFTDASNFDRGFVRWNSNVFQIGTERAGSYTTTRALNFVVGGSFAGGVQVIEYAGIGIRGSSPAGQRAAFVGNSNQGHGYYSSSIGWESGATAGFGNSFGAFTLSDIDGRSVMCPGQGPVHATDQRTGLQTLSALTTDATTRPLAIPNMVGPGTHNAVPIATNHSCTIRGCIVAVRDTNTETASFVVDACVQNAGGTVTLVSNSVTQTSNNGNVWTVTVNANNVTKCWEILCTGEAGKNIRWSGVFLVAQVAY